MKKLIISGIYWYQEITKIFTRRRRCVFYPTCSSYTQEAIEKYGVLLGLVKGVKRVFRCHPWQKNLIDILT